MCLCISIERVDTVDWGDLDRLRHQGWDGPTIPPHTTPPSPPFSHAQVRIRDGKLAIMGTASIAEAEDGMPFTLLTGVGLAGDGHIVYLDSPELVLNPEAPLPIKVPLGTIRAFDVDIGDNARIERIEIDDRLGVSVTARTLITPAPPFLVTDVGKRAAFLYDVGAFFSSFFGFVDTYDLGLEP